jgi:signal transduction histidine kinase
VRIVVFVEPDFDETVQNTLVIQVADTGRGMSESKKQEILSGKAVSEPGTSGKKGYGFGISLVLHLIDKANGSVDIQSEVDKGTRFEVRLPI